MDFQDLIAQEKKRILQEISQLTSQKADIDSAITQLNQEMKAVIAYETAKTGKTTRTRGKSVKAQILSLLQAKPMNRADIIDALGMEDKGQTVSNTLSALKREKKLVLKDGTYSVT